MNKLKVVAISSLILSSMLVSGCANVFLKTQEVNDILIDVDKRDDNKIKDAIKDYIKNSYNKDYSDIKIVDINKFKKKLIIGEKEYDIGFVDLDSQKDFFEKEMKEYPDAEEKSLRMHIGIDLLISYGPGIADKFMYEFDDNKKTVTLRYDDQELTLDREGK